MESTDRCVDLFLGGAMADWVRNTVMLTVIAVWLVYVVVTLARGDDVDAIVWGVPTTIWFAMNPSWKKGSKDGQS